jgi:hypothetical protein
MGKRGPTPAHERIRALPGREERRPPPPADLTEAQATMWRSITETEPQSLFDSAARQHLLRLYVEHATFRARVQGLIDRTPVEAFADPDAAGVFEAMLRARDRETKQLVSGCASQTKPATRHTPRRLHHATTQAQARGRGSNDA